MKVFLSHAIADTDLIRLLKYNCTRNGIELMIAEHSIDVNNPITNKIEQMLDRADFALFLLTEKGHDSKFVHQEIGYVQRLKIPRLFVVQQGYTLTGFSFGMDKIEIDPLNPTLAIRHALSVLIAHKKRKEQADLRQRHNRGLIITGAFFALAFLSDSK